MSDINKLIIKMWESRFQIGTIARLLEIPRDEVKEVAREHMRELLSTKNDVGIAEYLGITRARVGQIRRDLGLPKSKIHTAYTPPEKYYRVRERNKKIVKEFRNSPLPSNRDKIRSLSEKYGVQTTTIRAILREAGIILKRKGIPIDSKEEFKEMLDKYGSFSAIAEALGYTQVYISILAKKYGMQRWKRGTFRFRNKTHFKNLYRKYSSFREMALDLKVSPSYVCKKAVSYGIKSKQISRRK